MTFNKRSQTLLARVHPDLQRLATEALRVSPVPFIVTEGLRTLARQRVLVREGLSKTMRSRHLTGHAIDVAALVENKITWSPPIYVRLYDAFKAASVTTQVPFRWGGDWDGDGNHKDETFFDGVHFELPASRYPADEATRRVRGVTDATQAKVARTLAYGSRGERVAELQRHLAARTNAPIKADGVFGTRTREAVIRFQRNNNLEPTGVADHATLKALKIPL